MSTARELLDRLESQGAPALARAILRAYTVAGALEDWDSETVEWILAELKSVANVLPGLSETGDWRTVAKDLGVEIAGVES